MFPVPSGVRRCLSTGPCLRSNLPGGCSTARVAPRETRSSPEDCCRWAAVRFHLSAGRETARAVGRRHGPAVVLVVDSRSMFVDGHRFFRAVNAVWLTDHVPPAYLEQDPLDG